LGGHCVLQKLLRLEQLGFELEPDAAIFCVRAVESQLLVQHLAKCLKKGIVSPANYRDVVEQITSGAGVNGECQRDDQAKLAALCRRNI
jgi:hypothetical protein